MKSHLDTKSGFTLIEILVVLSIISLLSSIVLASVQTARNKARITADAQTLIQLSKALELYKAQNDNYPLFTPAPPNPGQSGSITLLSSNPSPVLGTEYIPKITDTKLGSSIYYQPNGWSFNCGSPTASNSYDSYLLRYNYTGPSGYAIPLPQLYYVTPAYPVTNSYCLIQK